MTRAFLYTITNKSFSQELRFRNYKEAFFKIKETENSITDERTYLKHTLVNGDQWVAIN